MEFQFLECTHTDFYSSIQLSDKVISLNMYECFMNTKFLCVCLKRYHANLSIKEGYTIGSHCSFLSLSVTSLS